MLPYEERIIFSAAMNEQELRVLKLKAEAFDRLVEKYKSLQDEAGFYSRNWVELAELIEAALEKLRGL